ncbi:MAG TPA: type IV pilus twitching motility protein PilT [Syntrophomonadaceae bacterium]|nr:type IV pilus twitching motility protein PilT [Syntrophomonadaceae bacterium]
MMIKAINIIEKAVEIGASDLHLTLSRPPIYRVNGKITYDENEQTLTGEDIIRLGQEILPDEKLLQELEAVGQVDFSNSFPGIGRFRANLYIQRGSWAVAIRIIPIKIPNIRDLQLPDITANFALREKGLVLVTGITGSGKSTTLAAMLNLMNQTRNNHIITLEDPIEYLHRHGTCIVNQREIGTDTPSFALGLRAALRQDPDVIMVGEMRDLETVSTAITAAETGHLVLASLHSSSAIQTIERIVDVFPPHQQQQITIQLANSLQGIISQELLPRADGNGRIVATEVLVATPAIRNLIRENKTHQIYSTIQTGMSHGMVTMDRSLKELYQQNLITLDEVNKRWSNLYNFNR